jgi:ABC-type lipoprotein release transport system permease subunit
MSFLDILKLALRNLRQAKLRATLTTMGVIVGVAVIVTMVSFGLGLQRNLVARFGALDLFNEIQVFGRGLSNLAGLDRSGGRDEEERRSGRRKPATRILDDTGIKEIATIPGVAYVEPNVNFNVYVRSNGKLLTQSVGGANIPNSSTRFQQFHGGQMISSMTAEEAVVTERFTRDFGYEKPADAVGKTLELLAAPDDKKEAETEEEETPNFFGIP